MSHPPRLRIRQLPPRPPIRSRLATPQPAPATRLGRALRSVRTWYQRADWSKHTAVIAAVVAAAGLGVTAWSTLISARVAEDQLAQSEEQRTQESMRQASRITFWREPGATVIANRSLDPADVYIDAMAISDVATLNDTYHLGTVPPCVRVKLSTSELQAYMSVDLPGNSESAFVMSLGIIDTYGQRWMRMLGQPQWTEAVGGTLVRAEPWPYPSDVFETDQDDWLLTKTSMDPLEECSAGT
jgi:hypothetical protein